MALRSPITLSLVTLFFISSLEAMDAQAAAWPEELYHKAFLGANIAPLTKPLQEELALAKKLRRAKKKVSTLDEAQRVSRDWLYTLTWVGKNVDERSFLSWTVKDIQSIAASLSKLSEPHPGAFRTKPEHRVLRSPTAEEGKIYYPLFAEYFGKLPAHPLPHLEPLSFDPPGLHYFHEHPSHIEERLASALRNAQTDFAACRYLPSLLARAEECARIGGEFAFQLLSIRPFTSSHMRLGTVIMFILLRQAGLRPAGPDDREDYLHAAFQCLVKNSSAPLVDLWKNLVKSKGTALLPLYSLFQDRLHVASHDQQIASHSIDLEVSAEEQEERGESSLGDDGYEEFKADSAEESLASTEELPDDTPVAAHGGGREQEDEELSEAGQILRLMARLAGDGFNVATVSCNDTDCRECREIKRLMSDRRSVAAQPVTQAKKTCASCTTPENGALFKRCSRCKIVVYCSEKCQQSHWKIHKPECTLTTSK